MPAFDVITIGSALLDIYLKSDQFLKLPTEKFTDGVALALEHGGKTEVKETEVVSGGAATNNAVSFARKGLKTAIIAELGVDLVAATIKEELKRENVDVGMLIEENHEETGISCILVCPDGSRSVAVYRGASKMLTSEDIPWHRLDAKWLYISSLGGDINLLNELIKFAKDNDIKVAVNPGKPELEKLSTLNYELLTTVDILILNREEAALLTKEPFEQEEYWKKPQTIAGPSVCLITDGRNGGKVTVDGVTQFFTSKVVNTIEETGAGDAFGSGFVAALIKGSDVHAALTLAKEQAASVVSYMGAKRGLLRR